MIDFSFSFQWIFHSFSEKGFFFYFPMKLRWANMIIFESLCKVHSICICNCGLFCIILSILFQNDFPEGFYVILFSWNLWYHWFILMWGMIFDLWPIKNWTFYTAFGKTIPLLKSYDFIVWYLAWHFIILILRIENQPKEKNFTDNAFAVNFEYGLNLETKKEIILKFLTKRSKLFCYKEKS